MKSKKRTQEEFERDVFNAVKDEYTVIGKYINTDTKVKIRHNICNKEFEVRPYLFLGKISTRCPHCNGNKKRTTEDYREIVERLAFHEYEVLGEYKNTDTPIKMMHNICKKEFLMRPACFIRGQRCPHCARSLGAEKIKNFLEKNNIKYVSEKKYDDLVDVRHLKFDFWLDEYNTLIEYDGEQHFRLKTFGKEMNESKIQFELLQKHDSMKNEYCIKNDIPLLRIPFWRYDSIEIILEEFISILSNSEKRSTLNEFIDNIFSKNKK